MAKGLLSKLSEVLQSAYEAVANVFSGAKAEAVSVACGAKEMLEETVDAAHDVAVEIKDGVVSAARNVDAARREYVYTRQFRQYDGKRYLVCTCNGKTSAEELRFDEAAGEYYAIGRLPDPPFGRGDEVPAPIKPYHQEKIRKPLPGLTHLNGIDVTPAQGIQSARVLSGAVRDGCPQEDGCGCVLYTYSETQGSAKDFSDCLGAKMGLDDRVTKIQERDMRQAIESSDPTRRPLVISAHSRGSIHTDNAWKNVRDDLADKYYKQNPDKYDNSPEAIQAEKDAIAAQQAANATNPDAAVSPAMAGRVARRQKAKDMAERDANKTMNENVHVVTSGNAIRFPDPGQDVTNIYVADDKGKAKDSVTSLTGNTTHGQPVYVDDGTKSQAEKVAREDPIGDKYDDGNYHRFTQWYAKPVAAQYCNKKPKK